MPVPSIGPILPAKNPEEEQDDDEKSSSAATTTRVANHNRSPDNQIDSEAENGGDRQQQEQARHSTDKSPKRKWICIGALVCLAVAAVALVTGIVCGVTDSCSGGSSSSTNSSANNNIMFIGKDPIRDLLPEYTIQAIQEDPSSPERAAFDWLKAHPGLHELEDRRKRRLFALATFYYAFHGGEWKHCKTRSYLSYTVPECEWRDACYHKSVYCNEDGQLKELALDGMLASSLTSSSSSTANKLLRGSNMPLEIGMLSSLEVIRIKNFNITADLKDMIPTVLGTLVNLTTIEFSGDYLTGSIPVERLSLLTSLKEIILSDNLLSATVPSRISMFINLQTLKLNGNSLKGSIPSELALLSSTIQYLSIANNNLEGWIPNELSLLTSLNDTLSFSGNYLVGTVPDLAALTALKALALDDNILSKTLPTQLANMKSLQSFSVGANHITGAIPSELGLLTSLTSLVLSRNAVSKRIPSELGHLTSLQDLSLYSNNLSGSIIHNLELLWSLRRLVLHNNTLTGTIPTQIGLLQSLQELLLNDNRLSGPVPSHMRSLALLQNISLYNNPDLIGTIPESLCELPKLENMLFDCDVLTCPVHCRCTCCDNHTQDCSQLFIPNAD